ncbi:Nonribosomal peptide synthetase [Dispira simplex]|nr:Nonribosomal peptide synthetase [Dispira simplex]
MTSPVEKARVQKYLARLSDFRTECLLPCLRPEEPGCGFRTRPFPLALLNTEGFFTVSTLSAACWAILLSRYHRSPKQSFAFSSQCTSSIEQSLYPVFLDVTQDLPLGEFLHRVEIALQEWTDMKLSSLALGGLARDEGMPADTFMVFGDTNICPQDSETDWFFSGYTMGVVINTTAGPLSHHEYHGICIWDSEKVHPDAVRELIAQYTTLWETLVSGLNGGDVKQMLTRLVGKLEWVSPKEFDRLVTFAHGLTASTHNANPDGSESTWRSVDQIFSECARRNPTLVAVEHEDRQLTYRELEQQTSVVARVLHTSHGIRCEHRVALLMHKTVNLIVATLGVLKGGGAYVPIDPKYPTSRIGYILQDSEASLVIVDPSTKSLVPTDYTGEVMVLDPADLESALTGDWESLGGKDVPSTFGVESAPHHLAYIIYTSGTTGRPKGVLLEHGGLANIATEPTMLEYYGKHQRVLLFFSVAFDGALYDTFRTLCHGGTLVLPGTDMLHDLTRVHGMLTTPSFLTRLRPEDFPNLRFLISAGEVCPDKLKNTWAPHVAFGNVYGPTETTIIAQIAQISPTERVTIGRPVRGYQNYVVDEQLALVPVSVVGELLIGGIGVARGYNNLPELTKDRFIANPFGPGRVYRTGDLVRWLPDRRLDYLGRMDNQIKLRGFRIELGEIEAVLADHPEIQQAVALVKHQQLVAYFTPPGPESSALLAFAKQRLPQYMVPDQFIALDHFQMTANNKVDRQALPDPTPKEEPENHSPYSETFQWSNQELQMRDAWAQILQVPSASLRQNSHFFQVGGDSIVAILLVSKCRTLGYRLTVPMIYEHPVLTDLVRMWSPLDHTSNFQGQIEGPVALTPIQRWYFELPFKNRHHFNQSFTLRVQRKLTPEEVGNALAHLANHHDMLRVRYQSPSNEHNEWVQVIPRGEATPLDFLVTEHQITSDAPTFYDVIRTVQSSLNITHGPILAVAIFPGSDNCEEGTCRLFITIHHVLTDLVSWRIIIQDLETLLKEGPTALPPKTMSFQEWSRRLDQYAVTLSADIWPTQPFSPTQRPRLLELTPEQLDQPLTCPRRSVAQTFSTTFTQSLLFSLAPQWRVTPRDVLLATFTEAYCHAMGLEEARFCMEGHGREPWQEDLDITRTVGWFTALYPLVLRVGSSNSLVDILKHTKESMQRIPRKGFPYSVLRHSLGTPSSERARLMAQSPDKLDVQFNYFGQFNDTHGDDEGGLLSIEWSNLYGLHDFALNDHVIFDLYVISVVNNGCLHLAVEYNPLAYAHEWVENIAERWERNLRHLETMGHTNCVVPIAPIVTRFEFDHLCLTDDELQHIGGELARRRIPLGQVEDMFPCTPMQAGLIFATLRSPDAYLVQLGMTLTGSFHVSKFQETWSTFTTHHSIIRTVFVESTAANANGVVQVVLRQAPVEWVVATTPLESREAFFLTNRAKGFTLARPLIRIHIFPTDRSDQTELVLTFHHALLDGWSIPIMLQQLFQFYSTGDRNLLSVSDFKSTARLINQQDKAAAKTFWSEYLADVPLTPAPLLDPALGEGWEFTDYFERLTIPKATLMTYAQRHGITLSTLMRGAFAIILSRYLLTEDVVFGSTVAGRNLDVPGIDGKIYPCFNTIPVRVRLGDYPLLSWLQRIQADQVSMIPYEQTSMVDIPAWRGLAIDSRLLNTAVGFENYPMVDVGDKSAIKLSNLRVHEFSEHPIVLGFDEHPSYLLCKVLYCSSLYPPRMPTALVSHLHRVLDQFLHAGPDTQLPEITLSDTLISNLSISSDREEETTHVDRSPGLIELLIEQVQTHPNLVAYNQVSQTLTYEKLYHIVVSTASALLEHGITTDDTVVVLAQDTVALTLGLLAGYAVGATAIPIPLTDPLEYILPDVIKRTKPQCLLISPMCHEHVLSTVSSTLPVVVFNNDPAYNVDSITLPLETQGRLGFTTADGTLFYVPEDKAMRSSLENAISQIIEPGDHVVHSFSVGSELAVWVTLATLIRGGTVDVENQNVTFTSGAMGNEIVIKKGDTISVRLILLSLTLLAYESTLVSDLAPCPVYTYHDTPFSSQWLVNQTVGSPPKLSGQEVKGTLVIIDQYGHHCPPGVLGWLVSENGTKSREILAYYESESFICVVGPASRSTIVSGIYLPLGLLDQLLARFGAIRPRIIKHCDEQLVAFVHNSPHEVEDLRTVLAEHLAPHWVPQQLISYDEFPHVLTGRQRDPHQQGFVSAFVSTHNVGDTYRSPREMWVAITVHELFGKPRAPAVTRNEIIQFTPKDVLALSIRIQQRYGIMLTLRNIVDHQTVSSLAHTIDTALSPRKPSRPSRKEPLALGNWLPTELTKVTPATDYQSALWVASEDTEYYHQLTVRLNQSVDGYQLQKRWDHFVINHESLRSRFTALQDRLYCQVFWKLDGLKIRQLHWDQVLSEMDSPAHSYWDTLHLPLCPEGNNLVDILVTHSRESTVGGEFACGVLSVRIHPLVGTGELLGELAYHLLGLTDKNCVDWPQPLHIPMMNDSLTDGIAYWETLLTPLPDTLLLPLKKSPTMDSLGSSKSLRSALAPRVVGKFFDWTTSHNITLVDILAGVVAAFLGRYTAQDDLILNVTNKPDQMGTLLPVRISLQEDSQLWNLATAVGQQRRKGLAYSPAALDHVLSSLVREQKITQLSPSLVTITACHDRVMTLGQEIGSTNVWQRDVPFLISPLTVRLAVGNNQSMAIETVYSSDYLCKENMTSFCDNLAHFVNQVLDDHMGISSISLVQPSEAEMLLSEFATCSKMDNLEISHNLFHIERVFDNINQGDSQIALESRHEQVTYAELGRLIRSIVGQLQTRGVVSHDRVAIVVESCPITVAVMLAVWAIGAVYVPIDVNFPTQRQIYMAEVSKCSAAFNATDRTCDWATTIKTDRTSSVSSTFPVTTPAAHDVACVIFTSGTTGQPKGVQLCHGGLANLFHTEFRLCAEPGTRLLQTMAVGFDAFLYVSLLPLCYRGTVVFADGDLPETLTKVDAAFLTPSLLGSLHPEHYPQLKKVVAAGEPLPRALANRWLITTELYNVYGPTEVTIFSHISRVVPEGPVTVGYPVSGSCCYILDPQLRTVPIGGVGEIYIGGSGVTPGYVNREDLNQRLFVVNPFGPGRLYRTGDYGRWLPGGEVEVLGRGDSQVKLHGFRIELDEVRGAYLAQPGVHDAAVLAYKDYLVGFVCPNTLDSNQLVKHVTQLLPSYMIPHFTLALPQLPTTINGKVDRTELQGRFQAHLAKGSTPLVVTKEDSTVEVVEIRQTEEVPEQRILREAIASVLNLPTHEIDLSLPFVRLGGDSIRAIQLVSKCRQLGWKLPVPLVLKNQALVLTAQSMEAVATTCRRRNTLLSAFRAVPYGLPFPFTPVQQWFLGQEFRNPDHFNQSLLFELTLPVPFARLQHAVWQLVNTHDMLRCQFSQDPDTQQWQQRILPPHDSPPDLLSEHRCSSHQLYGVLLDVQRSLVLSEGRLFALGVISLDPESTTKPLDSKELSPLTLLFITAHHLVVDLISWSILLSDLSKLLTTPITKLPTPELTFSSWANALNTQSTKLQLEKNHKPLLQANNLEERFLPTLVCPRRSTLNRAGSFVNVSVKVSLENSAAILGASQFVRPVELMTAALFRALRSIALHDRITVYHESHGRYSWVEGIDVARTVGWFTTIIPAHINFHSVDSLPTLIRLTKQALRGVTDHGVFENHSLDGLPRVIPGQNEVMFNYLGQTTTSETLTNGGEAPWVPRPDLMPLEAVCDPDEELPMVLNVLGVQTEQGLTFSLRHCPRVLAADTVQRLVSAFSDALNGVAHLQKTSPELCYWAPVEYPLLNTTCATLASLEQCLQDLSISPVDVEDIYPCLPVQRGLLAATARDPVQYTVQYALTITGVSSAAQLLKAITTLAHRHAILRTAFLLDWKDGVQILTRSPRMDWRTISTWAETGAMDEEDYLQRDYQRGFTLTQPLLRFCVMETQRATCRVVMTIHHALIDGWSFGLFLTQLREALDATQPTSPASRGKNLQQPRDYISHLQTLKSEKSIDFWQEYLAGLALPTELKLPNDPVAKSALAEHHVSLYSDYPGLHRLVQQAGVTVHALIRTAWVVLLHLYTDQRDILFGNTTSGRALDLPGVEQLMGCFVNTIPVRIKWEDNTSLLELIFHIHDEASRIAQFEHNHLMDIATWVPTEPPLPQLFNTLIVYENYPLTALDQVSEKVQFRDIVTQQATEYALSVAVENRSEGLQAMLTWDTAKFAGPYVERLASHFTRLFQKTVTCLTDSTQDLPVDHLQLLTEEELREVGWCRETPQHSHMPLKQIPELFQEVVKSTPHAPALEYGELQWTYIELDRQVEQLARFLQSTGVLPGDRVGLLIHRQPSTIVAMLAVMRIGAVQVPIGPTYPVERVRFIVQDCGIRLVLTNDTLSKWTDHLDELVDLGMYSLADKIDCTTEYSTPLIKTNPVNPESLAYIIYTSGTTGHPKGVKVAYQGISNLVREGPSLFQWPSNPRFLQSLSLTFDASQFEIHATLCNGGTLVLCEELVETLGKVDIIVTTPTILSSLDPSRYPQLKVALVGGEAMSEQVVTRWSPYCRVFNLYGPTEASVFCHAMECRPGKKITIGKPIPGMECYILDSVGRSVPPGVGGELYLGGVGITPGYVNHPDREEKVLVPNRFSKTGRLYRSGDLCRYLLDGTIEYLGRLDNQIKLRGFRIELQEVESVALSHPGVTQAVALVTNQHLYLFVRPAGLATEPLQIRLANSLPPYMLPSAVFTRDHLPLSTTGKIDRRALAEVILTETRADQYEGRVQGPRTPHQRLMRDALAVTLALDPQQVDIHSSFFQLGGDSISAIQFSSRCYSAGLVVTVGDIFKHRSIAALAEVVSTRLNIKNGISSPPSLSLSRRSSYSSSGEMVQLPGISPAQHSSILEEVYRTLDITAENVELVEPASSLQHGFIVSTLKDPTSYVIQTVCEIKGPLDPDRYREAWRAMGERHEVLRTQFVILTDGKTNTAPCYPGGVVQVITRRFEFEWNYSEETCISRDQEVDWTNTMLLANEQRGFTLNQPLVRISLVKRESDRYLSFLTFHHALLDAWSRTLVLDELWRVYRGESLPPPVPYHRFITHLQNQSRDQARQFWTTAMQDVRPTPDLALPSLVTPTTEPEGTSEVFTRVVGPTHDTLLQFCRQHHLTPNTLILGAWSLLLHRYLANAAEVTFGVTLSGRDGTIPGIETMVGPCINTLPLRISISDGEQSVLDWLTDVQLRFGNVIKYEQTSLSDIRRWAGLTGDVELFRSLVMYERLPVISTGSDFEVASQLDINSTMVSGRNTTEYPLNGIFTDRDDGHLEVHIMYHPGLYDIGYVRFMVDYIDHVLHSIVSSAGADPVRDLAGLSQSELDSVRKWSQGLSRQYPEDDMLLHQLFTEKVQLCPDRVALETLHDAYTYQQIYNIVLRLAMHLKSRGMAPTQPVGLLLPRSVWFVVSYLAVLLAGGVVVPMDPHNAIERLRFILTEVGQPILLTLVELRNLATVDLTYDVEQVILVDDVLSHPDGTNVSSCQEYLQSLPASEATDLAYIVFTSGTTGQPKGVPVTHSAARNFILCAKDTLELGPADRFLQCFNVAFDGCVAEMFSIFAAGGTLVHQEDDFHHELHRITACMVTPSLLSTVDPEDYPNLRSVVVGAEALSYQLAQRWASRLTLVNMYGPTEAAIGCLGCRIQPGSVVTIGRPIPNVSCYILDALLRPVPPGVPGQLIISGRGIGRGYWQRPELTQAKFLTNPFGKGRMYCTGDQVCWLPNGTVLFHGRQDLQVKLRGFRIELAEIESLCLMIPKVTLAAAVVKDERQLVLYLTPEEIDPREVKAVLVNKLPQYMVPDRVITLSDMPRTLIGKVDRQTLQERDLTPESPDNESAQLVDAATMDDPLFVALSKALVTTLGLEPSAVTPTVSFYRLGGDSISAIQYAIQCQRQGVKVSVAQILRYPILIELVQQVTWSTELDNPTLRKAGASDVTPTGVVPWTAVSRWYFESGLRYMDRFNQSFLLTCQIPLTKDILLPALIRMVNHHDMLRGRVILTPQGWQQLVLPDLTGDITLEQLIHFEEATFSAEELETWISKIQTTVRITHPGPALACGLFTVGSQQMVFLVIHHFVVDLVSWRILLEDLQTLLIGRNLPPKTLSFRHWAQLVQQRAQTLPLLEEAWPRYDPVEFLPVEQGAALLKEPNQPTYHTALVGTSTLDLEDTQALFHAAAELSQVTPQEFMLAGLMVALHYRFGTRSFEVELESHGRHPWETNMDISRTVGWFTAPYPVAFHLPSTHTSLAQSSAENTWDNLLLRHVKHRLRSVPNRGFEYGLMRYLKVTEDAGEEEDLPPGNYWRTFNVEPAVRNRILFNFTGRFDHLASNQAFWRFADSSIEWRHDIRRDEPMSRLWTAYCSFDKDQRLQFGLVTSSVYYRETTIHGLVNEWRDQVQGLARMVLRHQQPCLTVTDFPLLKLDEPGFYGLMDHDLARCGLNSLEVEDIYPCLPLQESFLHALRKDPTAYQIQVTYTVRQLLDHERFQEAWQALAQAHPVFRTRFLSGTTLHPTLQLQVITKSFTPQWTIQECPDGTLEHSVESYVEQTLAKGFKPFDTMVRFGLFRESPYHHRFVFTAHHLILDGWSLGLMIQELVQRYQGLTPVNRGFYGDFVEYVVTQDMDKARQAWSRELADMVEPTYLVAPTPIDSRLESNMTGGLYGMIEHSVTDIGLINTFSQTQQVTLSTVLRTTWALVLQHYVNQDDIVFGTVVSGRTSPIPYMENIIGLCINTIPCRVNSTTDSSLRDMVRAIHDYSVRLTGFEHCSLEDIKSWCQFPNDRPLYNTILVVENYPRTPNANVDSIQLEPHGYKDFTSHPFCVAVDVVDSGLRLTFKYDRKLFSEEFVHQISRHFTTALQQLVTVDLDMPIGQFYLLNDEERSQVLHYWATSTDELSDVILCNDADDNDDDNHNSQKVKVHHRFLSLCTEIPDQVALRTDTVSYTYAKLNSLADALVAHLHHQLADQPVVEDTILGVVSGVSVSLLICQLAIWKLGAAFVVIDPEFPTERQRLIVQDSQCTAVLGSSSQLTNLVSLTHCVFLPDDLEDWFPHSEITHKFLPIRNSQLAYVIYTSGTTGIPKGVPIEHAAVAYTLGGLQHYAQISPKSTVPFKFQPTFDASIAEIWVTLSFGGTLHLAHRDIHSVLGHCTVLMCTPSMLQTLEPVQYPELDCVILGGESVTQELVQRWAPHVRLFNAYGPTEATIVTHCTALEVGHPITIGRPLPYDAGYILDRCGRPVPVGVTGELYLGGRGIARGYLHRPELTSAHFITNTFGLTGRLFRAGDLARWTSTGDIVCIGRADQQVKIRGYRVELGEVESALLTCNAVHQACVVVQGSQLIGFVIPSTVDKKQTLDVLRSRLPPYMIPYTIVGLDEFPHTASGKLDRKALPKVDLVKTSQNPGVSSGMSLDRPMTVMEERLVTLLAEVLNTDPGLVSLDSTFFDLGGSSLEAMHLITRCQKEGISLAIADLNRENSIAQLAMIAEES